MHPLNPHIKELLTLYDCVIIPGLGGFVSASVPARFDAKKNRFIAPFKEISFNKNLKHNDGLLCQSVMKSEHVDFKTAQSRIEGWVKDINKQISNGCFSIRDVGDLFFNDQGNMVFRPSQTEQLTRDAFGLSSFYFPELEAKDLNTVLPQRSTQLVSKGSVSRWLAAASIFIMLLLFSKPTAYNDIQNASMGVNLDTIIENVPIQQNTNPTEKPRMQVEEAKNLTIDSSFVLSANVKLVSKPVSTKEYHVIIASLSDRAQADLFTLNYCLGTFDEYQVLDNGMRHRVSVKVFQSKEAALPYLKEIRASHPFFKDAWILTVNK